jgi:uncharacterized membrane protein SpoIIM required for sporulation
MNLEILLNPSKAERNPGELFFVGAFYSAISMILGLLLFGQQTSTMGIAIAIVGIIPLFYSIVKFESHKDSLTGGNDEKWLLKQHSKAIVALLFVFLGMTTGYLAVFLFFSHATSSMLFDSQLQTLQSLNTYTGAHTSVTHSLGTIILNNLRVLAICIFFSVIFGSGALLVLSWNASVMAVAIGAFIREALLNNSTLTAVTMGLLRYSVHGIPEVVSYLIGSVAGGITFYAFVNHEFKNKHAIDIAFLTIIATLTLIIAALLEVFVTPLLF